MTTTKNRVCKKCGKTKPLTSKYFYYQNKLAFNLKYFFWECIACARERQKRYYDKTHGTIKKMQILREDDEAREALAR